MSGVVLWILLACFGGIVLAGALAGWAYRRLHDEYNREDSGGAHHG